MFLLEESNSCGTSEAFLAKTLQAKLPKTEMHITYSCCIMPCIQLRSRKAMRRPVQLLSRENSRLKAQSVKDNSAAQQSSPHDEPKNLFLRTGHTFEDIDEHSSYFSYWAAPSPPSPPNLVDTSSAAKQTSPHPSKRAKTNGAIDEAEAKDTTRQMLTDHCALLERLKPHRNRRDCATWDDELGCRCHGRVTPPWETECIVIPPHGCEEDISNLAYILQPSPRVEKNPFLCFASFMSCLGLRVISFKL